jgi:hypothetical protein
MTWIKSNKRLTCFILAVITGLLFLVIPKCSEVTQTRYSTPIQANKIDSIAKSFSPKKIESNLAPSEKLVYKKKNKVLRKEAEKKDIILDIKIVDNHVIEDIIDTSGQVTEKTLDIPVKLDEGVKEVIINQEGEGQTKEKTWTGKAIQNFGKAAEKGLIVIGGGAVVVGTAVIGAPIAVVAGVGVVTTIAVVAILKKKRLKKS